MKGKVRMEANSLGAGLQTERNRTIDKFQRMNQEANPWPVAPPIIYETVKFECAIFHIYIRVHSFQSPNRTENLQQQNSNERTERTEIEHKKLKRAPIRCFVFTSRVMALPSNPFRIMMLSYDVLFDRCQS